MQYHQSSNSISRCPQIAKEVLDYPQLVNTLEVIKEALSSTVHYHDMPPLASIRHRCSTAQSKLKNILFYRYREVGIVSIAANMQLLDCEHNGPAFA